MAEFSATFNAKEIAKGLGFKGTLEDIGIAVGAEKMVRYSVIMPTADFVKAMRVSGDVTKIEAAEMDGSVSSVVVTSVGEIAEPKKRGRKPKTVTP